MPDKFDNLEKSVRELQDLYDDPDIVTTADKLQQPDPKQSVQEIKMFNRFNKDYPNYADGGMLVKPNVDGSRPGYAKDKKGPGGQPKQYNLEAIEEAIMKANQGDKYVSYEELGKKFGFESAGRISGIVRREGITPLDSYKVKVEKAFLKLFSDPDKSAMELTKPLHRIKDMIGGYKYRKNANPNRSRVEDISNALKQSKLLKWDEEVKPIINKLSSANFLKNVNKDWTLADVENTIQTKSMLKTPKTDAERLMDYAVRNQIASKGNTEFSLYKKNNLNKRITDFSQIDSYHDIAFKDASGKVYDLDYIRTKGRSDPLFTEYFKLQDDLLDMKNRTTWPDGSDIIDPKTGKKTTFGNYSGQMYKFGYGYKKPFSRFPYEIDHKDGVAKNPFKNLAVLPQRVNVGLGAAYRLDKPEIADKMGKDYFRNLPIDDLLMQEKNLGSKILLFNDQGEHVGKKLKTSYMAAKDEITRKQPVTNTKEILPLAKIGCPNKMADGGRVNFANGEDVVGCAIRGLNKIKNTAPEKLGPIEKSNLKNFTKTASNARLLKNVLGPAALAYEGLFAAPFAVYDYASGRPGEDVLKNFLTLGIADQKLYENELKRKFPDYGKAQYLMDFDDRLMEYERQMGGTKRQAMRAKPLYKKALEKFENDPTRLEFAQTDDPAAALFENFLKSQEAVQGVAQDRANLAAERGFGESAPQLDLGDFSYGEMAKGGRAGFESGTIPGGYTDDAYAYLREMDDEI